MKRLLTCFFALMAFLVSCTEFDDSPIWDKLNDYEERISKLEIECRKINTNIIALQSILQALQNCEYITNVSPITELDVQIGYTIVFSSGKCITIYHGVDGKDGQDGTDGKDGVTPVIGVANGSDGIYYWTVNGLWLLDKNGNKVKAVGTDGKDGTPGQDGADGAPGKDGNDGVTPLLNIENGKWFVSYDNGETWIELGQATGEQGPQGEAGATGSQGNPGQNGDSFFQSVTETSECVLLVLVDGTRIKIPKYLTVAATVALDNLTGFTATFIGTVNQYSRDLKVTIYYGTTQNITIYRHMGANSVTEFNGDTFTLRLTELAANTTYYYFSEVISNGTATFSELDSFRTGSEDTYVEWGEGENVGA